MKTKYIYIALLAATVVACGPKEETNTELSTLYAERDSLVDLQGTVADRLRVLEGEIIAKDSTRRLTAVTTISLAPETFNHYFQVYGTVEASKSISVYPETNGIITRINVSRGQKVSQGQLLAELDGSILQRNVAEIKTNLELANTLYEKQRRLWVEEKIGSEVQFLQAKNNKEALETRLATLNQQLSMTKVRAPFSGVIDEIFPKEGEMGSTMQPIVRLVNLSDVYVSADVSEAYVGTITKGTPAMLEISSINKKLDTEVVQVGQFINPSNRTFKIEIALDDQKDVYKPNMLVAINLLDQTADTAIVVPSSVVQQAPNGDSFVYVAKPISNDVAEVERIEVTVGASYKGNTQIKSGLNKGQILIDKGSRGVKDGQRVRIANN